MSTTKIEKTGIHFKIDVFAAVAVVDAKGWYTLGDKFQQHVEATHCSDKSLRVYWRIFVKIFVAATEFCRRNKSHRFSLI